LDGQVRDLVKVGPNPAFIAITPDGNTAYVANSRGDTVTPIHTATNRPGKEVAVGLDPEAIAITRNGTTAYVTNSGTGTVTPIRTAANVAGKEIKVGRASSNRHQALTNAFS
jgi:YVTN family beta-propeller protein